MPLGYLSLIEACINEIWRIKLSWMPVASPRALPRLPPPQPLLMLSQPVATPSLSEAIYSAASNLGTSVPHQTWRTPTCLPDQAEMDQAVRVLEGINKAPGTMPDHSKPRTVPWRWRSKLEENTNPVFKLPQAQHSSRHKFNASLIFREVVALSIY